MLIFTIHLYFLIQVKKHEHLIPDGQRDLDFSSIYRLRNSINKDFYEQRKATLLSDWDSHAEMHEFSKRQWMDGVFCNWQLYLTPPGIAMSNSRVL